MGAGAVGLLSAVLFTSTASIGAFPVLVPEMGLALGLGDLWLGVAAGAFGLARLVTNVPAGALVARRLGLGVTAAPALVAAGVLAIAAGGPFWLVVAGRVLTGAGHALGMVSAITAILRYGDPARVAAGLNALEMAGMVGVLIGMATAGALPHDLPWNHAFLVASAPVVVGLVLAPRARAALAATRPPESRAAPGVPPMPPAAGGRSAVPLAFAAGTAIALAWSGVGQIIIPLRGVRELGLDRGHIATLLVALQLADAVALMPVAVLADRRSPRAVLTLALLALSVALWLIAFGGLASVVVGCLVFGAGLAGWMLPLGILRRQTSPARIAARTAVYRIGVDGGIFLGPLVAAAWGPEGFALACLAVLLGVAAGVARTKP